MENYRKAETIELDNETLPFGDYLQPNVVNMKIKNGTQIRNIVDYSLRHFANNKNETQIVFSSSANSSYKAISCAEIFKRKLANKSQPLHQITRIGYKTVEEIWRPKVELLDDIKVVRKIPVIYILISRDQLDCNELGYQSSDQLNAMFLNLDNNESNSNDNNNANSSKYKRYSHKSKHRKVT